MRYVLARFQSEFETKAYRIFVTQYLKGIGRFEGASYNDFLSNIYKPKKEYTSDEVIDNIRHKITQLGGG